MLKQSRRYYRRFYRLVSFAVILMTAVLTGSLLLGDSVRDTLVRRVGERLGATETVITSGTGFMSDAVMQQPLLKDAEGYLLMDGFVSVGDKLLPVYVWGTDTDSLSPGEILINAPLNSQLSPNSSTRQLVNSSTIIIHLPSHNLVPSGSLFVTRSYATQMRVSVAGVKSVEEGGNLLLKNEQTLPLNVFVNRQYLAEEMGLEGKINLILSGRIIPEEEFAAVWTPEMSGIHQTDSSLTSDAIFISRDIVDKFANSSTIYFSYLANQLVYFRLCRMSASEAEANSSTVNYPFITAVSAWQGEALEGRDMILSDYAARRLHVSEGDSVVMDYYVARDLKNLDTRAQSFRVKRIVPLSSFMHDSLLTADFPGLSHVERCTDWDSDLPINMERVTKEDEAFWYAYRQTPKALVSYQAVSGDWSNAYGSATALRFSSRPDVSLSPRDAGVQLVYPRARGLQGAHGGVDFAGLFLALGFFIILAAVLLMKNTLEEMFTLRQAEISLYRQLGFSEGTVRRSLFREAFIVMLQASPWGVVAALLYSSLTLWLLGNVWSGATHTEGFALSVHLHTLFFGWAAGVLICALVLWRVLWRRSRGHVATSSRRGSNGYIFAGLLFLTLLLTVVNFISLHSMALFVVCGLLWILTWGQFLRLYVQRRQSGEIHRIRLVWSSVRASLGQHLLAYWTLSLGVFAVFAVGLNRPDFTREREATGTYQLYVDSRVPIQYDLNNPLVRQKLSLESLPDTTRFLAFMRHTQDEASCLNLNQVATPTVLGVDLKEMEPFGLRDSSLFTLHPSLFIDEESLTWSLKKSVGDTLYYQNGRGESVPVVIAGTYPTGIFHGNAIMPAEQFRRLWPKESGVEVLLVKSSDPDEAAEVLSTVMGEYGLSVQTTEERLRMFFEVTETYLVIFLTLGGLGLLLGIFSLIIIVRKNLAVQDVVIRQYRAMGFSEELICQLLLRENLIVPLYAVCAGATGALISISANVRGAGYATLLFATLALAVLTASLVVGIRIIVKQYIINTETT